MNRYLLRRSSDHRFLPQTFLEIEPLQTMRRKTMRFREAFKHSPTTKGLLSAASLAAVAAFAIAAQAQPGAFLPPQVYDISTVPSNGDVNPYGVAFIASNFQAGTGPLLPGDILVSNFNNNQNLQGTGSTIVRFSNNQQTLFFQGSAGIGLSTALGTLQKGLIVVGNAPSTDGTSSTATAGSLLVINNQGQLIQTITDPNIQSPWDMTLLDEGSEAVAFVTNALTGTVVRLSFLESATGLKLIHSVVIASGYVHRGDPAAFFVAPTGLVFDQGTGDLFVASTGDNAVFVLHHALGISSSQGTGTIVYQDNVHLHGALALAEAPNGDLLVSNNDTINPDPNQPSEVVEFTKQGAFVKELSMDPAFGGSFGLAVNTVNNVSTFATIDDNTASLFIWTLPQQP
jgi:hypothetical protein